MAGRGCVISIQLLSSEETEELHLPVALHSPLSVLRDQLQDLTNIAIRDQVLILLDLTDPERNNDLLLEGRDFMTLRDIGFKHGSVLTLHALGMPAELKQKQTHEALKKKLEAERADKDMMLSEEERKRSLATTITAAQANHSYNGVIFDVQCNGPYELELLSLSIGGMLGRVRVYARDRPWEADKPQRSNSPHWWAHRESVSDVGWTLVADVPCRPSWDKPCEIVFDKPVKLLPHSRRGLYCHSGLPDDLGIQYQSYPSKDSVVARDDYLTLLPGLGHTGSAPFDDVNGWYRSWRGLAGSVAYRAKWKGWSPMEHRLFPTELKDAVRTMLLCQGREREEVAAASLKGEESDLKRAAGSSSSSGGSSSSAGAMECDIVGTDVDVNVSLYAAPKLVPSPQSFKLSKLPKYVVYNILEYVHWDWCKEVADFRREQELRAKMMEENARIQRAAAAGGGSLDGASARRQFLRSMAQAILPQPVTHTDDDDEDNDDDDDDNDDDDDDDDEEEEGGYAAQGFGGMTAGQVILLQLERGSGGYIWMYHAI